MICKANQVIVVLALLSFLVSCTQNQDPQNVPDLKTYTQDTELMSKILTKFINDPNVTNMREIAIGTQTVRPINCVDFNEECHLYNEGLSLIIEYARDGQLTANEKEKLNQIVSDLKNASYQGQDKIRALKK